MLDSFPDTLRALREANGLTFRDLEKLTSFSAGYLNKIELRQRTATADVATACDRVFHTAPLLSVLLAIEKGHDMLRRALFGGTLGVAGGALLASVDTSAALAAVVNAGLRAGTGQDWDGLAEDFARRHVLESGPGFGAELAAHIMIAHQGAIDGDTDAARGAAQLTLVYALWIGDAGKLSTAHSLYATAAALADSAADRRLQAYVRARAASRGPYEGWPMQRCEDTARRALALCADGPAAVEAHGVIVHIAALTGRLDLGRSAVRAMYEQAVTGDAPSTWARAASFDNFLECRAGTLADAHAAYERTAGTLAEVPLWAAEAAIYLGRAEVAAGDPAGAARALAAISRFTRPDRFLGLAVADLLAAAQTGVRSEELAVLRGYASPGPTPWEAPH